MLHGGSGVDGFFGTTYAMENEHKIWNFKCEESPLVMFFKISIKIITKLYVRFNGNADHIWNGIFVHNEII
jgi:hypothetical protein